MRIRLVRKLKSRSGESLTEILVALLVTCISVAMLAGAITSAKNISFKTKAKMAEYYEANNALSAETGEADAVTMTVKIDGTARPVRPDTDSSVDVSVYRNETFEDTVYSYTVPED